MRVSRRSVLKAFGLGSTAVVLGWRPALSAPGTPLSAAPDTLPATLTGTHKLGQVVRVSTYNPSSMLPEDLLTLAEDKIRRDIERAAHEYGLTTPVSDECWFHVEPGADHHDPLALSHAIGMSQLWRAA